MEAYFRGRNLVLFILGAGVLTVAIALWPPQSEWRHTLQMALIVGALAPWALATMFRKKVGAYLAFALVTVGIMALVELVARQS